MDQTTARRRAAELGGIAREAWLSDTGAWKIGGWSAEQREEFTCWVVTDLAGTTVLEHGEDNLPMTAGDRAFFSDPERPLEEQEQELDALRKKIERHPNPPEAWYEQEQKLTDELSDRKNILGLCYDTTCRNPVNECPAHDNPGGH